VFLAEEEVALDLHTQPKEPSRRQQDSLISTKDKKKGKKKK
jgi:hypothetical protein